MSQKHLTELYDQWQNYDRQLEACRHYVRSVVAPFMQTAVVDSVSAAYDVKTQHQRAQVQFNTPIRPENSVLSVAV